MINHNRNESETMSPTTTEQLQAIYTNTILDAAGRRMRMTYLLEELEACIAANTENALDWAENHPKRIDRFEDQVELLIERLTRMSGNSN